MDSKKWVGVNKNEYQNWTRQILYGENGDYVTSILWHELDEQYLNYFECWTHCPVKVPRKKDKNSRNV